MAFRPAGAFNGYVAEPSKYAIGFVRNPSKFKLNRYAQFVPAEAALTRYFQMDPDQPSRVVNLDENAWAYGDYRKQGKANVIQGQWNPVSCGRWDFGYTLDYETMKSWERGGRNPKALYNAVVLQQGMTHRTTRALNALLAANWGSNTAEANALNFGAGRWNKASGTELIGGVANPSYLAIKKTLNSVKIIVDIATNSAIGDDEWQVVIPPIVAIAMGQSGEFTEINKQQVNALRDIITQKNTGWRNEKWGIPDSYAGFDLVVEDCVSTTVRMKDDGVTVAAIFSGKNHVLAGQNSVYVTTRPGGVNGMPDAPSFATLQLHWYEYETKISLFDEPKHELVDGHAVFQDAPVLAAPTSGFQITNVLDQSFINAVQAA